MTNKIYFTFCMLCPFALISCSDSTSLPEQEAVASSPSVTVIFSTNGLGDMTYNDNMLDGVVSFINAHGDSVDAHLVTPYSSGQGETAFKKWLTEAYEPSKSKRLLVLASSEYEQMLANENPTLAEGNNILLLESNRQQWADGISAIDINLYGISYVAGKLIASLSKNRTLAVLAMPGDSKLNEGLQGLQDGLSVGTLVGNPIEETTSTPKLDIKYLADDAAGYAMADSAFKMTAHVAQARSYDWIYPLCGGSALGIYRYLDGRAQPNVVGMDAECGELCYALPFSVVRNVGNILRSNLEEWYQGKALPTHRTYGLKDGYTVIQNSSRRMQSTNWEELAKPLMQEAIDKEEEYKKQQQKSY